MSELLTMYFSELNQVLESESINDDQIDEADIHITNISFEIKKLKGIPKEKAQLQLIECRNKLTDIKTQIKKKELLSTNKNKSVDSLKKKLSPNPDLKNQDYNQMTAEERSLKELSSLKDSLAKLDNCENLGAATLTELEKQKEVLLHSKGLLQTTNDKLSYSNKLTNRMSKWYRS